MEALHWVDDCKHCVENHGRKLLPCTKVTYEYVTTCIEILTVLLP